MSSYVTSDHWASDSRSGDITPGSGSHAHPPATTCCSVTQLCPTHCDLMDCRMPASLSFTISRSCSNSCPLSPRCHPTISSSVVPFSSHLQSVPASGSFPMSRLFPSSGQSIGASASASVLPMNIQGWFPERWLVWSPCCSRDSQGSSPTPQFKSINSSVFSFLYNPYKAV